MTERENKMKTKMDAQKKLVSFTGVDKEILKEKSWCQE